MKEANGGRKERMLEKRMESTRRYLYSIKIRKLDHNKVIFRMLSLKQMQFQKGPQNRKPRGVRSPCPVNLNKPKSGQACLPQSVAMRRRAVTADNVTWLKRLNNSFKVTIEYRVLCKYSQCFVEFHYRALQTLLTLVKSLLVKQILFLAIVLAFSSIPKLH